MVQRKSGSKGRKTRKLRVRTSRIKHRAASKSPRAAKLQAKPIARSTTGHAPGINHDRFPIVGIGASAGGLETFGQLLSLLPTDTGMGYVYVQHLDPNHESLLTPLLARHTTMPVKEARHGMKVERNHVYIIPPKTDLGLQHGKLTLQPRAEGREPHMSVDHFLRELASDQRNLAIGVILSGTASDGAHGLQAIKEQGGVTIVQQPESAKYDGMPRSAVASGAADLVLALADIARELTRIARHPYLKAPDSDMGPAVLHKEPAEEADELMQVFRLLRRGCGVDFSHYKPTTIKRRVARRMAINRIENISGYLAFIESTPVELDALYQDLLINVTSFFRDAETSEALRTEVLPKLLKDWRGNTPFRAWIPGCATGEEAYSLAIILLEHLSASGTHIPVQIFATDVSDAALEKARRGIYSKAALADFSPERLRRFFSKVND
ncbi:MAG TPA: chemotaxis protein CheB, partial [Burkholderiales bacterium]|nr:chemotaxis protein CheB [Burkholderiales bacterium]